MRKSAPLQSVRYGCGARYGLQEGKSFRCVRSHFHYLRYHSDRKRPFLRVRTESTRKIRSVQDSDWLHGVDEFYITAALTEAQLHNFFLKTNK